MNINYTSKKLISICIPVKNESDNIISIYNEIKKLFLNDLISYDYEIIFTDNLVEHWLNGKKVLSFVPWSDDWYKKKNSGKWDNMPDYGKFKSGYIGFQDHGSDLWFKNVKIKKL